MNNLEEKQELIELVIHNINTVPNDLLSFVGQVLIHDQNFEQAYEVLSKIVSTTEDLKIKAGYLSSLAEKDVKKASDYFEKIDFKLPQLANERDIYDLIQAPLDRFKQDKRKKEKRLVETIEHTKKGGKLFSEFFYL